MNKLYQLLNSVVYLFDECLAKVVLRVAVDGLILAEDSIEYTRRLFVIDFSLFAEVNAADPFVLNLLKGGFDLHDDC